jgi:L,D-peptidoglycan transpeptidase YkuD (ErfK/YbiS/YcfS/YnhG family)
VKLYCSGKAISPAYYLRVHVGINIQNAMHMHRSAVFFHVIKTALVSKKKVI